MLSLCILCHHQLTYDLTDKAPYVVLEICITIIMAGAGAVKNMINYNQLLLFIVGNYLDEMIVYECNKRLDVFFKLWFMLTVSFNQVSRSSSVPSNTRDSLYQGLPPTMKNAFRCRLQSFQIKEEVCNCENLSLNLAKKYITRSIISCLKYDLVIC